MRIPAISVVGIFYCETPKEYLVKGYAVNERIRKEQIGELRQLVGMLGRTMQNQTVYTRKGSFELPFSLI